MGGVGAITGLGMETAAAAAALEQECGEGQVVLF
jgi:hypothetical protein